MKDSIDLGSMDISKLFRKLLIPTVLGMVLSAIFVITDGIFVGKGIGSDALAAVNITAPLFMITTGIGLMFGVGASVVASIHLSQGKRKVASINITQALAVSVIIILVMSALCFYFVEPLARLLGSSERLMPDVVEYMIWYVPFLVFYVLLNAGMFYIRLDGSPNYAMLCNAVSAVLNIILDYIFIFEFGWGLMGAAFATSLGITVGSLMTIVYLTGYSRYIRLNRIKLSQKSLLLTIRNIGYMIKLGISAFISEASIACMMFLGNYVFIRHLGELHSVLSATSSQLFSWYIMRLHNPPNQLSAIISELIYRYVYARLFIFPYGQPYCVEYVFSRLLLFVANTLSLYSLIVATQLLRLPKKEFLILQSVTSSSHSIWWE